jgi:hypothetical protein
MLVPAAAQIIRVWSLCYGQGPISQADQNDGYLEPSLSMPRLTRRSAALTCSWTAFT